MESAEGWSTQTSKKMKKHQTVAATTSVNEKVGCKEASPLLSPKSRTRQSKRSTGASRKWTQPAEENGNGKASFLKLIEYLRYTAHPKHVFQLVVRIQELARQRRFEIIKASLQSVDDANKKEALLNEWADEMPAKMYERYATYALNWDYANENDTLKLARTLYNWIVIEKITRKELNQRIQLFVFLNKPGLTEYMPVTRAEQPRSYKDALQTGSGGVEPPNTVRFGSENLHQPTSFQMEPLRHSRLITDEEREHLNMILSRRLEEASPPVFLSQIFTPGQVAIFMELLQDQEYALYGHLMAGHFVREGLSQSALFQLVDAGPAAVADQQQHVQRLKSEIVRMELNQETRVVTFFFRSQRVAKQWNGMVCPFDGKGLRLVDYEEIRRQNPKAILRIDTYRFSLLLLRGKISPVEMYDLRTKELKLKAISIKHPNLNEQTRGRERWEIIVDGPVCPPVLTNYTRIQLPKTHLLIHLSDVHIHLPCEKCSNKWHSHHRCPVQHDDCKQAADKRTLKIMRQEQASSIKKEIASTGPSIQNVDQLFEFFCANGCTGDQGEYAEGGSCVLALNGQSSRF